MAADAPVTGGSAECGHPSLVELGDLAAWSPERLDRRASTEPAVH
jgi:hypothetical protein